MVPDLNIARSASIHTDNKNAMADMLCSRRVEMKDSASVSETGSDIGDTNTQENKDDILESGFVEERFRVDRKKLEQMLQGNWEHRDEAADDFFQRIMEETNTQISWPSKLKIGAKSKKDPHIKVIGLPDDVHMAKDLIMAVLDTKSNRATLKMDVSYTDHSHVIGKGGNNIKRVMQETGCHVHFPDSNRGNSVQEKSNQVSIAGQPQGVEAARIQIRELLPLVFEIPITTIPVQLPDVQSPAIQQIQQQYNLSVSFRQRARMYPTAIIVRGSVYNWKLVKEGTLKLMELMIPNLATPLPVSMQLEIAAQHHLFIIGRGGMNIKQIMQTTGAAIHFPDPNTVTPQRKGTVYITGSIDSVYLARQQLIGCLPLVLMFDVKEEIDMDQARLTQLMEHLDVFINVKPKPKQPSKSVIVKSIERNASNMYLARLLLLGIEKEIPRQQTPSNGESQPTYDFSLSYFRQVSQLQSAAAAVHGAPLTINTGNQILLVNGHKSPPSATTPSTSTAQSPRSPLSTVVSSSAQSHFISPPPGIYGPVMVIPQVSTCSVQGTVDLINQVNINGLQKEVNQTTNIKQVHTQRETAGNRVHSEANSPTRSPCGSPLAQREKSPLNFREKSPLIFREKSPLNFRETNAVDLAGLSTANSFHKFLSQSSSSLASSAHTMDFLGLSKSASKPSLTSSGHTMDLLGLSKTTHPQMNNIPFLNTSLSNGSLHGSLNRPSLRNSEDRRIDPDLDLRAPGIERKSSQTNLFIDDYQTYGVDYEQKRMMATKAMQKKPIGESRIPTDFWSGYGFSKSVPSAAFKEGMAQAGVKQKYEPPMATTYENSVGELNEMDSYPWKDSISNYNPPLNPAPGEYPSPRKKYEYGLSASNHIDGAIVPNKSYWSPKTDLAELFIKLGLGKYTDLFQQQEIDLSTFLTMTEDDLRELGISTFGARRKMLLAITDLNTKRRTWNTQNSPLEDTDLLQETTSPRGSHPDLASLSGRW